MPNEIETVDSSNNEEVLEQTEEIEESEPEREEKPQKRKLSDEEQYAIHQRELKKLGKRLGKDGEESPKEAQGKSSELDLGAIAYLNSLVGLKGKDEIALAREYIANGKSILDLAENKYFKQDLDALREARATADATPKATKRTPAPSRDDVSHWVDKPFSEVPDHMKQQVLDAKVNREKGQGVFSNSPIVYGGAQPQ